jgi:preprotein translocase subunit SecG
MNNIWMNLILALQLLSGLAVVGLVLVQHGKGADMGASFGSGASGSLFGATGSANFLSRSTAIAAAIFFAATLVLAYWGTSGAPRKADGGSSVLERSVPVPTPAASAVSPAASAVAPAASSTAPAPDTKPAPAAAAPAASGAAPAIPK